MGIKAHDARQRDIDIVEKDFKLGRKRTVDHQIGNRLFPKLTDPNKPFEGSLHNKIDLLRINDARKAFRQKYADRNHVDKIFDRYDSGKKGYIDAKDILKQSRAIGITMTLDEAQVLLQSAKPADGKADQRLS